MKSPDAMMEMRKKSSFRASIVVDSTCKSSCSFSKRRTSLVS